jgi:hypothetical protein
MGGTSRNGGFLVDFQPMSPEEIQRAMQFLLNQQAQAAVDFARFEAAMADNESRWTGRFDRIADGLLGLTKIVGQLAAAQVHTDEQIRELRDGDARLQGISTPSNRISTSSLGCSSNICARITAGGLHSTGAGCWVLGARCWALADRGIAVAVRL